jgi:hypothetical protein
VWQTKDFKSNDFGCVAKKELRERFFGCVANTRVRGRNGEGSLERPLSEAGEENGQGRKWAATNTGEDSGKYPACQLLYWYRSNEMWKNRRNPTLAAMSIGHSADVR